jgi:hypothetical protein
MNRLDLATDSYYIVSGVLMLVFMALIGFPPHVALLGVLSLATGYSIITKRSWSTWLIVIVLIVGSVFALDTVVNIGLTNYAVTGLLTAYAVLTWVFTVRLTLLKKSD